MKFNHLTEGTNYYVTEDTKNIFSKSVYKSFSEKVFWQMVKEGGEALEIIRGIFFKGNIKENSYELIVMDRKRNILMCSAGVADVESQKIVQRIVIIYACADFDVTFSCVNRHLQNPQNSASFIIQFCKNLIFNIILRIIIF